MTSTQNAVARVDNSPAGMVQQYRGDFAQLLPSHVNADTWVRLATGALRKNPDLARAAAANPASLMAALSDAARLGLEPGTEQFYLTPRKARGQDEVLGIIGYQGIIELMYRAGAVSSIVAEIVYANDTFTYSPGVQDRPIHGIDWDAPDRGSIRLVYAYAVMKDGATSKVVVLNRAGIEKIKGASSSAKSNYSPWTSHEDAMWLKSAVRQLRKWVPMSAEYIREQLRAVRDVSAEPLGTTTLPARDVADILHTDDMDVDAETGEVIYEATLVEPTLDGE